MLVDGRPRDKSFQRKTGYVQQQDLHLHTSTVREALEFSAVLRQPPQYSRAERLAYVETVIDLLDMREYADAIVGVPGTGLNVEQRKRLTIGVELAARPKLLLFLDEPTSGLDSQTSWSICNLMETLTKNGQAILCTIHQPSAMLFQRFDRLLLLARGGKTVYFGGVGQGSKTLMDYFVHNGAPACPPSTNPAEHMLEVIGAAPGAKTDIDWPAVWRNSPEYQEMHRELAQLRKLADRPLPMSDPNDKSSHSEFAAPFTEQLIYVGRRVFQQYWRSPSYIYSKVLLTVGCVSISLSLSDILWYLTCSGRLYSSASHSSKWKIHSKASRIRCLVFSCSFSCLSNWLCKSFLHLSHSERSTKLENGSPRPMRGRRLFFLTSPLNLRGIRYAFVVLFFPLTRG